MTFPNNSVIAASGWNKQNIYLSIYLSWVLYIINQLPVGLLAQLIRALCWYCRGKPEVFQAFFSQLYKLCL